MNPMVCDSNIYAAEPGDTLCLPYVEQAQAMIASVTRIEVLGFPRFGGTVRRTAGTPGGAGGRHGGTCAG
ncbi:MAG: hypothetical protein JWR15_1551 [Prosthecobacter sp.]|nr:hypothetical protein [Prosthecobacter sp.]